MKLMLVDETGTAHFVANVTEGVREAEDIPTGYLLSEEGLDILADIKAIYKQVQRRGEK